MFANTWCDQEAAQLLSNCLAGIAVDQEIIARLIARDCISALFRIVAEGLADRFEPRLCDAYADVFSEILHGTLPEYNAQWLRERYERVRVPRACTLEPSHIYVLSRVTLGADIAITSAVLDAAKLRFPQARITLVGGKKSAELFIEDSRIEHDELNYPRSGSFRERFGIWQGWDTRLQDPAAIVVDPDSRLTQLGLLPICDENRYFFFESRAAGSHSDAALSTLTQQWAEQVFGVAGRSYLAVKREPFAPQRFPVAISFGVGENASKRIPAPFETNLLRYLHSLGAFLVIDRGAGGEEAARVDQAIADAGIPEGSMTVCNGSFASFVSLLSYCSLYVGYDSAGQHAAAALGVPLVTIFAGFPSERMMARWTPKGAGPIEIVKVVHRDVEVVLTQTQEAIGKVTSAFA